MAPSKRPTSADVALLSGVSRATVSYVLNADPRQTISESTRRRVLWAAGELGYVASAAAASLRRGHSRIVLIALDPLYSGHVSDQIVDAVVERLRMDGYVGLRHSDADPRTIVDVAEQVGPVGVISLTHLTPDIRERLNAVGVQRIVDNEIPDDADGPLDRTWELPIGQLQVDHLAGRGCTRIVYALPSDPTRLEIAEARLRGARMECTTLGLPEPTVISVPLERGAIARQLKALDRTHGPIGLCAYDDQIAIGVLGATADLGWLTPGDLSVIGSDDLPVASLTVPSLTTVRVDASRIGAFAAEQFCGLGANESKLFDAFEPTWDVIQRKSS